MKTRRLTGFLLVFIIMLYPIELVNAKILGLTVETTRKSYFSGTNVKIYGNLTLDGASIYHELVGIQVDDPKGRLFVIRTRPAGISPPRRWSLEIVDVTPINSQGVPSSVFKLGEIAFFKTTVINNDLSDKDVDITLNVYDGDNAPFDARVSYEGKVAPLQTVVVVTAIYIPRNIAVGYATVYANAFNKLPQEGGFSYCPEKAAVFTIENNTSSLGSTSKSGVSLSSLPGNYNLTFKVSPLHKLGYYQIFTSSYSQLWFTLNSSLFQVTLKGDVNGDCKVNIRDMSLVARHFGSYPGHVRWNSTADLNEDEKVNIRDVAIVGMNFGKSCPQEYDPPSEFASESYDSNGPRTSSTSGLPTPRLEVSPTSIMYGPEPSVYEESEVQILIKNVTANLRLVSAQFKLRYNTILLQVVKISEGSFFSSFPNRADFPYTQFISFSDTDYISISSSLLPNKTGYWTNFPGGNGTVATIRFRVMYQGPFPTHTVNSTFDIYDISLLDLDGEHLSHGETVDGTYSIKGMTGGAYIDIFTHFPPSPFGGLFSNNPSDMFAPGEKVRLHARVTYDQWPVENKIVSFEIRDPSNGLRQFLTNTTNADGIAWVDFRIPQADGDPKSVWGEWKATASTSIADLVITDIVTFIVNDHARIFKVTTNRNNYTRGDNVQITVEYGTYSMKVYQVVLSIVMYDLFGVPIGFTFAKVPIGGATYGQYANFTSTIDMPIPEYTFPETATIHVMILTNFLWEGGSALTSKYTPLPEILILP